MRGLLRSMATTASTFLRRPVTRQYPETHRPIPQRDRAFPLLLWDSSKMDEPFCTGCHACERACPVECMTVLMKDNPNHTSQGGTSNRRKMVDKFWIDLRAVHALQHLRGGLQLRSHRYEQHMAGSRTLRARPHRT